MKLVLLSNFFLGKQDNHSQTFLKISNQSNHLTIIIFSIMEKNKSIIIGRFIKKILNKKQMPNILMNYIV